MLDDPGPGRDFAHDRVLHEGTSLRLGKPSVGRELADQHVEVRERGGPERGSGQGRTGGREARAGGTERRDADARGDQRDAGRTDEEDRGEHDHDADVDDVGETRARHPEQEDDVTADVERREDAASHLARRVPLEEHRPGYGRG